MSCTKAVATEQMPKPRVIAGRNHPGPIHLQAIYMPSAKLTSRVLRRGPDITWNFKDDVGDEEYRQYCIVVVANQSEILIETGEFRIAFVCSIGQQDTCLLRLFQGAPTNIGSVNKAKEIHQSDCRHNAQVNLQSKMRLGSLVELHNGMTILIRCEMTTLCSVMGDIHHDRSFVMHTGFFIGNRLIAGRRSVHGL